MVTEEREFPSSDPSVRSTSVLRETTNDHVSPLSQLNNHRESWALCCTERQHAVLLVCHETASQPSVTCGPPGCVRSVLTTPSFRAPGARPPERLGRGRAGAASGSHSEEQLMVAPAPFWTPNLPTLLGALHCPRSIPRRPCVWPDTSAQSHGQGSRGIADHRGHLHSHNGCPHS